MRVAISERPTIVSRDVRLRQGDVYRLPSSSRAVWVVSGCAWMTHGGEDILLSAGESMSIAQPRDPVVITSIGVAPLVLEVAGR